MRCILHWRNWGGNDFLFRSTSLLWYLFCNFARHKNDLHHHRDCRAPRCDRQVENPVTNPEELGAKRGISNSQVTQPVVWSRPPTDLPWKILPFRKVAQERQAYGRSVLLHSELDQFRGEECKQKEEATARHIEVRQQNELVEQNRKRTFTQASKERQAIKADGAIAIKKERRAAGLCSLGASVELCRRFASDEGAPNT